MAGVLTRKVGPLPAWAWTAIAGGMVLLYVVWQGRKNASAQAQDTAAGNGNLTPPYIIQEQLYPPQQAATASTDTDEEEDEKKPKPKPKRKPPHRPRRHRPRRHPTHHPRPAGARAA